MADPVSANEQLFDIFTAHAIDLLRLEAHERKKALAFLNALEGEIVALLAKIDPTGVTRSRYQQERLERLLEQVQETVRTAYRDVNKYMVGELIDLADYEAAFVASSMNTVISVEMATATFTNAQLRGIVNGVLIEGAPITEWWSRQAGDTYQRFIDTMRQGMALGETNADLVRRVRGGTKAGEPVKGFMDISRRNAETLVISSVNSVANSARTQTYNDNSDLIKGKIWRSVLDEKTSLLCKVRDRRQYTLDNKPVGHDIPWLQGPGCIHFRCRATSLPLLYTRRELGFDMDEVKGKTRSSMDGQVPAEMNYEEWLKTKSAGFQDEMLGVSKARLWRADKISFHDLIDQSGRPRSLKELREIAKNRK